MPARHDSARGYAPATALPPIRTLTVGPGIPPARPLSNSPGRVVLEVRGLLPPVQTYTDPGARCSITKSKSMPEVIPEGEFIFFRGDSACARQESDSVVDAGQGRIGN